MFGRCHPKPSQSGYIYSSLSYVPKKSTVPNVTSPSCLLTAFLAALCPSGCSLSPEAKKVDSLKRFLKQSPRPVRVAAKLSACCELSTETNFQKSQPSPTSILHYDLSTVTCPAAPGLQRLCFCSSALSKPRPVPDTKRRTKITLITYTSTRYCRSILLAAGVCPECLPRVQFSDSFIE